MSYSFGEAAVLFLERDHYLNPMTLIQDGKTDFFKFIFDGVVSVHGADRYQHLVSHAARCNKEQILLYLLHNHGLQVDTVDRYGTTPLREAVNHGYERMVELLLERGARADAVDPQNGARNTLLMNSAKLYDGTIGKLLLNHGAHPKAKNSVFLTALHFCAASGNIELAQELLNRGCDIDAQALGRITPLRSAINNRNKVMVKFLIRAGADVTLNEGTGQEAIVGAVNHTNWEIVELLLLAGSTWYSIPLLYPEDEYEEELAELSNKLEKWPVVLTLRSLCLRVAFRNKLDTSLVPSALLEFPNEIEEQGHLEEIDRSQQAYRKRKREDEEETLFSERSVRQK